MGFEKTPFGASSRKEGVQIGAQRPRLRGRLLCLVLVLALLLLFLRLVSLGAGLPVLQQRHPLALLLPHRVHVEQRLLVLLPSRFRTNGRNPYLAYPGMLHSRNTFIEPKQIFLVSIS